MLMASNTDIAPWTVIKSDNKKKARLNCIKHILANVNYANKTNDNLFEIDGEILTSGTKEIENMEQDNKFARLS
jgi:polyphosphate kinase